MLALNRFSHWATQLRASWAGLANAEAFPKPRVAREQRSVKTVGWLDEPFHSLPNLILTIHRQSWGAGLAQEDSQAGNPGEGQRVANMSPFTTESFPAPAPFCSERPYGPMS